MIQSIPDPKPETSHPNRNWTPELTRPEIINDTNDDLYSKKVEISTRIEPDPNPIWHPKYGYPIFIQSETDPTRTGPNDPFDRSKLLIFLVQRPQVSLSHWVRTILFELDQPLSGKALPVKIFSIFTILELLNLT